MNYLEYAKNAEVKWFNWNWEGLSGRIWNVEDDCTTCDILINKSDIFSPLPSKKSGTPQSSRLLFQSHHHRHIALRISRSEIHPRREIHPKRRLAKSQSFVKFHKALLGRYHCHSVITPLARCLHSRAHELRRYASFAIQYRVNSGKRFNAKSIESGSQEDLMRLGGY